MRLSSVCLDLLIEDLGTSAENIDLPLGVEVANDGYRGTGKIAASCKSNLKLWLHAWNR
jgi:hypothetical protein